MSIQRKSSSNRFPRVLLFPEGTTTNGRCLLSFQLGAFIPGHPVQPVVVRYPHVHFDQSWGRIPLAKLIFRMLTQFHNFMEVEYLPVISPDSQKESPVSFSQRTSHAIATALNVVQTSYNFGDSLLSIKACEFKQENPSLYMVEMAGVQSLFRISSLEAVDFLKIFLSMDPDDRGHVEFPDFLNALRLKRSSLAEKIFSFIDQQNIGKITFKQFLLGSVYILKQPLFEPACKLAFRECRRNQNNFISEEEFGTSLVPAIPNLNKNEIHALFKLFDTDCDGKISKDDFFTCMRRNPLLIVLFFPLLMHIDLSPTPHSSRQEMV
ncbi:hypothetical protein Leryth_014853 [Lithospermum erythrorhizon]|nr:hypothetical protein Leryth_014853 [Lithospermum erythrorhizon]